MRSEPSSASDGCTGGSWMARLSRRSPIYLLVREHPSRQFPVATSGSGSNTARGPWPAGPQLVRVDPAQHADESSAAVQLMRNYEEVARLAARQQILVSNCRCF